MYARFVEFTCFWSFRGVDGSQFALFVMEDVLLLLFFAALHLALQGHIHVGLLQCYEC